MSRWKLLSHLSGLAAIGGALAFIDLWSNPLPLTFRMIASELVEGILLVAAMAGVAWNIWRIGDLNDSHAALANNLARNAAQGDAWREQRRQEIAALGRAIEDQFRIWNLTAAEIDIAGLMLKGATLKEIALSRDTSEATIRQQAQSVYRKSGLSGRAELSAYFLESLFEQAEDTVARRPELSVVSSGPSA